MNKALPLSLLAACILSILALGVVACSNLFAATSAESGSDASLHDVAAGSVHFLEMQPADDAIVSRVMQKQQVAKALIFGEVTLTYAAKQLRQLSGDEVSDHMRATYPDATDVEIWYRQVIAFVQGFGRSYPQQVAALIPKLEAEVAQRFAGRPTDAIGGTNTVTASPGGQSGSRATPPRTE